MAELDKWITMHELLWQEGGSMMTREALFKAQELVDDVLLDAQTRGQVRLKQNLDGRILSITKTSPGMRII